MANGEAADLDQAKDPHLGVYHITGTPAKFMGFIYDAPDEQTAIARDREI